MDLKRFKDSKEFDVFMVINKMHSHCEKKQLDECDKLKAVKKI